VAVAGWVEAAKGPTMAGGAALALEKRNDMLAIS
jgi:hypothetical protein